MSLLKCPDCGKLISSRASACPDCGCPQKYFGTEECDQSMPALKEKEKPRKEIEFNILKGYKVTYDEEVTKWASIYGEYLKIAYLSKETLQNEYDKSGNISNVLGRIPEFAERFINMAVEITTKFLYKENIHTTIDDFYAKYEKKYGLDYSRYVNDVSESYERILESKNEFQQMRNAEKAAKGQWQGGGFGLKGAIKGAATAAMLNMGSDILHSFGDASRERQDNEEIKKRLEALYKKDETRAGVCDSVWSVIMGIFYSLSEEMSDRWSVRIQDAFDPKAANSLYLTTMSFAEDEVEKKSNLVRCIQLNPSIDDYYIPIIADLLDDDTEFDKFVDFWNIRPIFDRFYDVKEQALKSKSYADDCGLNSFNFRNFSVSNFMDLKWKIDKYYFETGIDLLKDDIYGSTINAFIKEVTYKRGFMVDFAKNMYIPLEESASSVFRYIRRNDEYISNVECFKSIWMLGDFESETEGENNRIKRMPVYPKKETKRELCSNNSVILMFSDESLMLSGKKGFCITTDFLIDLKTREKIPVREVSKVSVNEKCTAIIIGNDQFSFEILSMPCGYEKQELLYIANVISFIFIRVLANSLLWESTFGICKPDDNAVSLAERLADNIHEEWKQEDEKKHQRELAKKTEAEKRVREENDRIENMTEFESKFDEYMYEEGIRLSELNSDCEMEHLIAVSKVVYDYFNAEDSIEYYSYYKDRLHDLWRSADAKYSLAQLHQLYSDLANDISIEEYLLKFREAHMNIGRYIFRELDLSPEDEMSDAKIRKWIDADDTMLALVETSESLIEYSRGLGISKRVFVDLHSKKRIRYEDIISIDVDNSNGIVINGKANRIVVDTNDREEAYAFANFLRTICVLSSGNTAVLQLECQDKSEESKTEDAKSTGSETQSQNVIEEKLIYCTMCGKQIKANSKFCMFCGNTNKYMK